jgi:hypothetical protein
MKNKFNYCSLLLAFGAVFLLSTQHAMAQDAKECEQVARKIYQGVNDRKATHLVPYLSKNFSMAGYTGEIATEVFKAMLVQLKDKVSDIALVSTNRDKNLTLVFKAKWEGSGVEKSTFVFDKNNQLLSLELLPTLVKEQ